MSDARQPNGILRESKHKGRSRGQCCWHASRLDMTTHLQDVTSLSFQSFLDIMCRRHTYNLELTARSQNIAVSGSRALGCSMGLVCRTGSGAGKPKGVVAPPGLEGDAQRAAAVHEGGDGVQHRPLQLLPALPRQAWWGGGRGSRRA